MAKWITVGTIDVTQISVAAYLLLGLHQPLYAGILAALVAPQVLNHALLHFCTCWPLFRRVFCKLPDHSTLLLFSCVAHIFGHVCGKFFMCAMPPAKHHLPNSNIQVHVGRCKRALFYHCKCCCSCSLWRRQRPLVTLNLAASFPCITHMFPWFSQGVMHSSLRHVAFDSTIQHVITLAGCIKLQLRAILLKDPDALCLKPAASLAMTSFSRALISSLGCCRFSFK